MEKSQSYNVNSGQPHDKAGPIFREPWEASAFAMVVKLSEGGYFTWPEWVQYLSHEIASDVDHGHEPVDIHDDSGHDYYYHWFAALEKMIIDKNLVGIEAINTRHQFLRDNPVPHDHVARRTPIKIA
jgi:nitrile hydratase accessory protein